MTPIIGPFLGWLIGGATGLGAFIGAEYINAKIEDKTGWERPSIIGIIIDTVLVGGSMVAGSAIGGYIEQDNLYKKQLAEQNQKHIETIDNNVKKSTGFENFTGNAYTVGMNGNQPVVNILGKAIPKEGIYEQFCRVSYAIDAELSNEIKETISLVVTYDGDYKLENKVINGENSLQAMNNILGKIAKVTEGEVLDVVLGANVEGLMSNVQSKEGKDLSVYGVGDVNFNKDESKASFTIDLVKKDNIDLVVKRLVVTQDATQEMIADPKLAYENYCKNPKTCKIRSKELGSFKIAELTNGEDLYDVTVEM